MLLAIPRQGANPMIAGIHPILGRGTKGVGLFDCELFFMVFVF